MPSGSVADTNPLLMLPSNSSAALMKALSHVKRFWAKAVGLRAAGAPNGRERRSRRLSPS
jgi:hypothetical protein